MACWVAIALLLPLLLAPASRTVLARESNAMNAALLLSLTAATGLAAYLLVGSTLRGASLAGALITVGAAAFAYNWFVLATQERLQS